MSKKYLVTTIDNPFNPFTQFDEWNDYDMAMGYNTLSYLARIAKTSIELSEEEQELAINNAVEDIVRLNINGLYKKVVMDDGE